jgi:hypothetical protein
MQVEESAFPNWPRVLDVALRSSLPSVQHALKMDLAFPLQILPSSEVGHTLSRFSRTARFFGSGMGDTIIMI